MNIPDWEGDIKNPLEYFGFVYEITNLNSGKIYIGKKTYQKKIRRNPLKGNKRVRKCVVESDWKKYWGSSRQLLEDIEEYGYNSFKRTILCSYKTKWECTYYELKEQIDRSVLLSEDFYNGIIQVRLGGMKK